MPWYESFDKETAARLPQLEVLREEPMAGYTTFRIGGPARRLARPKSASELAALLQLAWEKGWPWLVLGKGSNLLVSDQGVDCMVVYTGGVDRVENGTEPNTIMAEAGASLARTAEFACRQGLGGLEFAHGIPGTVGGGVYMNAGAYGGEMRQVVAGVSVLFPEEGIRFLSCEEMDFSYRHSLLTDHPEAVALYAVFRLTRDDPQAIREKMRELFRRRQEKQPLEYPSAGSTFKRPAGHFAGTLIEQCGLKGARIGGAQVSEKHAGFIINTGGATCEDVLGLIRHVQAVVKEKTGVALEPEVKRVP